MSDVATKAADLLLRLYIAGNAPNSLRAVANAKAICLAHFAAAHELEIIDMLEDPRRALADGVIVTPTLLRLSPAPILRVIGDLSDTPRVLLTLAST
ncbi:MAG: circadian clock KaiB family protein [Myxococcota bacterium]|nr:circadian clock KaiB family protein [Myxococcota bacterium]